MSFFQSLESVLSVYILIALGFALTKRNILDMDMAGKFSWLIVNVTFPCYIIVALPEKFTVDMLGEAVFGFSVSFVMMLLLIPVGYLVAKWLKLPESRVGVFVAMILFSNTVYIGVPVCVALFGDVSMPYVLQYYLATTIMFWTVGVFILRRGSLTGKTGGSMWVSLFNMPIIASFIALAIVIFNIKLPFMITNSFEIMGAMTTPLAVLFMGIVFAGTNFKDFYFTKDIFVVMIARFAIAPLLIFAILAFFSAPKLMTEVLIIQAAMPIMNQVTITGHYYGADYKYSTIVTVWSCIISMVVIPIYIFLFNAGVFA